MFASAGRVTATAPPAPGSLRPPRAARSEPRRRRPGPAARSRAAPAWAREVRPETLRRWRPRRRDDFARHERAFSSRLDHLVSDAEDGDDVSRIRRILLDAGA